MKLSLNFERFPTLELEYENTEWTDIEGKLKELGLAKSHTSKGFGRLPLDFYQERDAELKQLLDNTLINGSGLIDDINRPLLDNYFNIALFRVIPNDNKVKIRLDKFVTLVDVRDLTQNIKGVLENLFSIVSKREIKIEIRD